jgi:hypothetical protein
MPASQRTGLLLLYCNVGLNIYGLATLIICNVSHVYCMPFIYYAYAAIFLGVPLFIATSALAPKGTFTLATPSQRTYRRLYFSNLGLVALIWLVPWLLSWRA